MSRSRTRSKQPLISARLSLRPCEHRQLAVSTTVAIARSLSQSPSPQKVSAWVLRLFCLAKRVNTTCSNSNVFQGQLGSLPGAQPFRFASNFDRRLEAGLLPPRHPLPQIPSRSTWTICRRDLGELGDGPSPKLRRRGPDGTIVTAAFGPTLRRPGKLGQCRHWV